MENQQALVKRIKVEHDVGECRQWPYADRYMVQPSQEEHFFRHIFSFLKRQRHLLKLAKVDMLDVDDKFFDYRKAILRTISDRSFTTDTLWTAGVEVTDGLTKRRPSYVITKITATHYQSKMEMVEGIRILIVRLEGKQEPHEIPTVVHFNNINCHRFIMVVSQELLFRSRVNAPHVRCARTNAIIYAPADKLPIIYNESLHDVYLLLVIIPVSSIATSLANSIIANTPEPSDCDCDAVCIKKEYFEDDDDDTYYLSSMPEDTSGCSFGDGK